MLQQTSYAEMMRCVPVCDVVAKLANAPHYVKRVSRPDA
jgi:hypothetical protein